jgi:phage terminase large subunit
MEFFGVDTPDKVRGPRRDILFMNEANNCPFESLNSWKSVLRTKSGWTGTRPTSFGSIPRFLPYRETDLDFITLTYKDNESLDVNIVKSIEARKHKPPGGRSTDWDN